MKRDDFQHLSAADLTKRAAELEEELFRLRFKKGAGQLKETANLKKVRRDRARALTALRQQQLSSAKESR